MSRLWRPLLQKCLPRGSVHSVFCTFNHVLWPVFPPATSTRAYMSLGPDETVNSPTLTEPVESIFSDSTAAHGHETSLDLSSGSSDSIERQPHSLAHFFAGILRPSFEDIEVAVKACVASQNSLQSLLERLSLDLSRLLQVISPSVDLTEYAQKLTNAKTRILTVYNQLQSLQVRIGALESRLSSHPPSVTQFLRSLDLTGVDFGAASQHVASCTETSGGSPLRRSKRKKLLEAASQVFPSTMPLERMSRLETLKLRDADLSEGELPSQLTHLSRLEYLSLAKNKLTHLTAIADWPAIFPRLRVLNCRRNALSAVDSIPSNIFECPNLQVIDFSCNNLTRVPRGLENASGLLVLNLSENKLTAIPEELFVQCTNLMLLDLSDNQLQTLPAHLRRCSSLQQLILSRNPLQHYPLRAVAAIKHLQVLHLSNTQRRLDNIPSELDRLEKLVDLDLSENQLNRIPEPVFQLRSLRKLDVSRNSITDLSMLTDNWPNLEYLNLSYNQLLCLPSGLTRLTKLRKLYINNNQLKFDGIPSGIGKLNDLEVFDASHNLLENIPEGLCRCGRLKRLLLSSNRLVTLPDAIHFLIENLEKFDVEDNPNLRFPERPTALQKGAGSAFYNIDFSLEAQLQLLRGGQTSDATSEATNAKDTAARIRRLRRRRFDGNVNDKDSSAVLAGMRHVANEKEAIMRRRHEDVVEEDKQISAKRWKDALTKPNLDYSEIFDQDAGLRPGVEVWVIDEFCPRRYDMEEFQGSLLDGDCYIVLETRTLESGDGFGAQGGLDWRIFYWIGKNASLDKRACSAVHAVYLRNFLGAEGQTTREEQGDESPDFLALFGGSLTVLEGAQGYTGFFHVEAKEVIVKLYRLFGQEKEMHVVSMPLTPLSLDPKYVYLIDGDSKLYVWMGSQARVLIQTRGRLLAEKIAQKERLNEAEILVESEGRESNEFLAVLLGLWKPPPLLNPNIDENDLQTTKTAGAVEADAAKRALEQERQAHKQKILTNHPKPPIVEKKPDPPRDFIPLDWKSPRPIVYDVKLGRGYLELLQTELPTGQLTRALLQSQNVYLVDCGGELYVWMGKKSAKFLRYAGFKLAQELMDMMPRGFYGGAESSLIAELISNCSTTLKRPAPQLCPEGAESQIFRTHFVDWEPAMAVDFTRTARSIAERGSDLNVIFERDKMKTDLRALLAPRDSALGWDEAMQLMQELNHELFEPMELNADFSHGSPTPSLQQFILDRDWVPVEPQWFGHFFNKDSYIVIARYWDDEDPSEAGGDPPSGAGPEKQQTRQHEASADVEPNSAPSAADFLSGASSDIDAASDCDPNAGGGELDSPSRTVVYFWQGREASDLAWLRFNFSLRKDMEARLSRNPRPDGQPLKVEFKRVRQQQEDLYFLAHFMRRMVIHSGHYRDRDTPERQNAVQLYHLRMNGNPIATRCIEASPLVLPTLHHRVKPTPTSLNSCFSYICRIPASKLESCAAAPSSGRDQVYIWVGDHAHEGDEPLLEAICHQIYSATKTEVLSISEGGENEAFWNALGGKRSYDKNADYMNYARLFRLSNDAGYFSASEKCADFCQDDLINDDVMMLDTGDQVYLWLGKRTSDVEVKLSLQAAKLYKENMARPPHSLSLTSLTTLYATLSIYLSTLLTAGSSP
ncbi:hypothetical protein SprV_0401638000 [Sparganum proliferum]